MPRMSKVELYAAIRRDHRGSMSMRELERKHGVTWRTVRKALDSSWPEPRKKLPPQATGVDRYKPVIDEILRADLDAPRKQRHTVTRIFHRLIEEHGADVSYGMVRYYVAARKPEILVESGKAPLEAFVPQTHQPGHERPRASGSDLAPPSTRCWTQLRMRNWRCRFPYKTKRTHLKLD